MSVDPKWIPPHAQLACRPFLVLADVRVKGSCVATFYCSGGRPRKGFVCGDSKLLTNCCDEFHSKCFIHVSNNHTSFPYTSVTDQQQFVQERIINR